jgi:2-octaprenyl-6-methoxyphenol hydroxylase
MVAEASDFLGEPFGGLDPLAEGSASARFPIMLSHAHTMGRDRVVLVGEAAHRLPPVGAQGFNLSLRDAKALGQALREAAHAEGLAERYSRGRKADVTTTVLAVERLTEFALAESEMVRGLRRLGVAALSRVPPLRAALAGAGLITRG